MAVFSVDSDAVLTQSAAVRATADRLHAESQAMLAQLTQLQASWTGRQRHPSRACSTSGA